MNPLPKAQSNVWILRVPVGNVIQSGWAKSKSVAEDSDMGKLCVRKRRLVGKRKQQQARQPEALERPRVPEQQFDNLILPLGRKEPI